MNIHDHKHLRIKDLIEKNAMLVAKRSKYKIHAAHVAEGIGISYKQFLLWEGGSIIDMIEKDLNKLLKAEEVLDTLIKKKIRKQKRLDKMKGGADEDIQLAK